jgi:hypothetical protein
MADGTFAYVLLKRRSATRKVVGGFVALRDAADAAQKELASSSTFDDFRTFVEGDPVPGL